MSGIEWQYHSMGESVAGDDERRSHVNTTQTMTRKSEQLRAVFLAALMVISVFGMTVAFAGSAAAATNSISLSDELVQDGEDIYVNGTVDANGTVVAFVDENGDGEFNTSDDGEDGISGEEVIQNHKEDGSYSIELTGLSLDSGTYDVYVFQEEEDEDYAISNGDTGERHAELQVDADEPTFGNETPEDGSALTSADEIEVPLKDANTSVAHVSATVQNSDNEITTYEIDPDEAYWDGVGIEDGDLVITPGKNDVPALTDGKYTVSVTAKDEVGNQNSTDFTFTVDSTKPQVEFSNVADDLVTNKENKSITVKLKPGDDRTLNDSTAELTIDGADDYEETLNSSFEGYTSSDNAGDNAKFEIEQDGDIPPLPDGEVTLTASVEDDAGNSVTESLDFEVDLESPSVETVELTDDEINSDDSDEKVHVTFDEANVQSDSVSVNVNIDGSTIETATGDGYVNNSVRETVVVPLDLSKDGYSPVENDSAVVNVTAATDEAGNSLENPDADASNTTFAIDTDGPTVTLEGSDNLPNGGTLSGLVNVTTFITDQSDVDQRTVTLEVGGQDESIDNEDAVVDITNSAENLSTQDLPDGTHTLIVTVEDDAGNTAQDEVVIDLDNGHAVDVSQSPVNYMPGLVTPVNVGTSDVTVSDVFETSLDAEEMTYEVNGTNVSSDYTITPEDNRGDTVNVSANGHTVTLEFAPLVGAESVSGDEIDIGVEADSELDELNVTVEATDDYTESEVRTLTIGNFDKVDNGSTIIYTTTVDDLRDGSYSVTIEDGSANLDGDTTATVDDEDPHITDADVVSAGSGHTFVKVEFNEPVDGVSAEDFTFTGDASVRSLDGDSDQSAGYVYVELDEEAQTAGDQSIEVVEGDYAEDTADSTNAAESVTVDTIEWQLTDDLNVLSIPAEAGEVSLSALNDGGPYDLDENHVDSVMTYEDGEWLSYNPSTGEGDLQYLEGGEGYIVKMDDGALDDGAVEIDIEAQNVPKNEDQALVSQSLETGWNLIGAYQEGPQPVGQALAYLDTTYDIEKGYTGTQVDTLRPGQGYWLFTNGEGHHAPVNYGGVSSERPDVVNVQLNDETGDGVIQPNEQVEIVATVSDDSKLTVDADVSDISNTDNVLLSKSSDGTYTATVTADAVDGTEETLGVGVKATDADGNYGFGGTDAETADTKLVTNTVTGAQYSTLSAALSEAQAHETLELSAGTFVQDRDSLTISTDNLLLKGQGTSATEIAADVTLAGDNTKVQDISYVANSPTGSVYVTGAGVSLDTVSADDTIEVNGDDATVSNSVANNITVNAAEASVSDSEASNKISVGSSATGTSLSNVEATTYEVSEESGATVENPQPAEGKVLNEDTLATFDSIQAAVDDAAKDETLLVGAGTYEESVNIGVEGLTLKSAVEGAATIEGTIFIGGSPSDPVSATGTTIHGFNIVDGTPSETTRGIGVTKSDQVTIANNTFDNFTTQISLDYAGAAPQDVTIENNTFSNAAAAIGSTGDVTGLLIEDNTFLNNDEAIGLGTGYSLAGDATIKTLLEQNSYSGNGYAVGDWTVDNAPAKYTADGALLVQNGDSIRSTIATAGNVNVDVVRITEGTYDESITIDVQGLTVEGANAGIAATSDDRGAETSITGTVTFAADSTTLNGVKVATDGSSNPPIDLGVVGDVTVKNNIVAGGSAAGGISSWTGSGATGDVLVRNNSVTSGPIGILVQGSDDKVSIIDNQVAGGDAEGIWVGTNGNQVAITGNTIKSSVDGKEDIKIIKSWAVDGAAAPSDVNGVTSDDLIAVASELVESNDAQDTGYVKLWDENVYDENGQVNN